ncbi:hypothetical protein SESBI_25438 [Sesbania bispinosa]|nr:hypothetical protein SESBI_25438 [Sesbania bispinosa]
MEDVSTVRQPSDLIVFVELAQTDGAAFGWVHQLPELHHRQEFPDQERGNGIEFGCPGRPIGPCNVGFEEIVETQIAEKDGNEFPDETQEGEDVKNQFWEEKLCIAHGKSHDRYLLLM